MKKTLIFLLVLVLVVGAAGYFGAGFIAKTAIERLSSRALGAGLEISSVNLSLLSGEATINGLKVRNPEGFYGDYALQVDQISAKAAGLSALLGNPLVIEKVAVRGLVLNFEMSVNGNNIYVLQGNANRYTRVVDEKGLSPRDDKRLVIKTLEISGPKLMIVPAGSKDAEVKGFEMPVNDITLNNIGEDSKPASVALVLSEVLKNILVKLPVIDRAAMRDTVRSVGDTVGGALGGALEGIKGAIDGQQ